MPPWDKYQAQQQSAVPAVAGPWQKYATDMSDRPPPQSQGEVVAPEGMRPGTPEYAAWAAEQARAGNVLPKVSDPKFTETQSSVLDPFVQGTTFGFADEMRGAVQGGLAALQGGDYGSVYDQTVDASRGALNHERAVNPAGSLAAEIAGGLVTGAGAGGQLAGKGATLGMRALTAAGVGAGQGAVYGAGASEGDLGERGTGAVLGALAGGAVGGAIPFAANAVARVAQRGEQAAVLNAAAKSAPTSDELKSAASALFEQATGGTPLAVTDNAYMRFLGGIQQTAKQLRINEVLDPKSVGLTEVMMSMADDLAHGGVSIDMKDLHILRQAAQRVAGSSEGRDAAFAGIVKSKLDDFIGTLKNADIQGGGDPKVAANALAKGITTWSRANRVSLIEEAIRKGQAAASGPEKGVRNALRGLFNKPDVWNRFSSAEQQAIKDVIDGTPGSNLMKLIGTFGFGGNTATNGVGGAAGMALGSLMGGPVGLVVGPAVGSVARRASEKITGKLADRAMAAAATDGLRVVPPVNSNKASVLEQALRRTLLPAAAPLIQAR